MSYVDRRLRTKMRQPAREAADLTITDISAGAFDMDVWECQLGM
jgi:hypothetical protein